MKKSLLFALLLLLAFVACNKQKHEEPQVSCGTLTQYKDFGSGRFVKPRTLRVWAPTGYNKDSLYSVLYMHDGQMLYDALFSWNGQEWGVDEIADSLIQQGRVRPFIVVGIDNNDKDRIAEFASDDVAQYLKPGEELYHDMTPMGNRYLRFVVEEVKPFIDSTYSVYRDQQHTYMMGSSCGGLISSYALCKYPQVFGGVACLSTHCTFMAMDLKKNPPATRAYIHYLKTHLPAPNTHRLYMDCGNKTADEAYVDIMAQISDTIQSLGWDQQHFTYRYFPGAKHCEDDWRARLPQILEWLMR